MVYYAIYDGDELLSIGKINKLVGEAAQFEITEAEYLTLETHIQTVAAAVDAVFDGTMSIDDVDASIRDEVAKQVAEREAAAEAMADEVTDSEALDIITGVSE